jgi:steroid 5-alpha reductase family enzyme
VLQTIVIALLQCWAIAAVIQLILWLIAQQSKNAGIVDVGWALSFTPIVWFLAWRSNLNTAQIIPIALVVTAWSLRLGFYLVARGAAHGPEEGRYRHLRQKWHPNASRAFFLFFQAQAALTGFLVIAFVIPLLTLPRSASILWAGLIVSIVGIIGEAISDAQLARFKKTATRGSVCDGGLWSWSRHPNYFFESLYWAGLGVTGFAYDSGWIAWASCILLTASIFRITGIPATEEQALRSKGDAYRAYQARTSVFVPWPPRRESNLADH